MNLPMLVLLSRTGMWQALVRALSALATGNGVQQVGCAAFNGKFPFLQTTQLQYSPSLQR